MKRKNFGGILVAAGIALLLAAPGRAEPLKIRVSWATAPSHITPLLPELPQEVYRHWGKSYVIEPVFIGGGGAMLTALAANEIEIAGQNYLSLASSVLTAKLDTRIILGLFASKPPNADNGFWVKADSGINKVTDLKGKVTAVNGRGSGVDAALRKMLRDNGLEDQRDYQVVEVRFPAMLPSLEAGRIDLAFLTTPFNFTAEKDPKYKMLFALRDALGPNETLVWETKAEFVQKNRAALVDMIEDNIRARQWLYDPKNHEEVVKIVAKVTKVPEESFRGWVFTVKDTYRSMDASFDAELLQKNMDDLAKLGITPGTIDVKKHSDLSMVAEAKKRLGM
jgi:NitT/TauT family transport system substrate-binding protein